MIWKYSLLFFVSDLRSLLFVAVTLDVCIALVILNTRFIIQNTKFIDLNANRYLERLHRFQNHRRVSAPGNTICHKIDPKTDCFSDVYSPGKVRPEATNGVDSDLNAARVPTPENMDAKFRPKIIILKYMPRLIDYSGEYVWSNLGPKSGVNYGFCYVYILVFPGVGTWPPPHQRPGVQNYELCIKIDGFCI